MKAYSLIFRWTARSLHLLTIKKYGDFYTSYWSPYSLFNYMRATQLSLAACATASATTAPTSLFKALGII